MEVVEEEVEDRVRRAGQAGDCGPGDQSVPVSPAGSVWQSRAASPHLAMLHLTESPLEQVWSGLVWRPLNWKVLIRKLSCVLCFVKQFYVVLVYLGNPSSHCVGKC